MVPKRFSGYSRLGGRGWIRGGGPDQREGDIFGENAFFGVSFYWPQDQESTLCSMNFGILTLMKWSYGHVGPVGFKRLPLTRWQVGGGAIPHKHGQVFLLKCGLALCGTV